MKWNDIRKEPLSEMFLAIFLVCFALTSVTNIEFVLGHVIMGLLAGAAGVLWFMKK